MTGRPRHVVIVGRDAALWLTAAALRHALGPAGVEVTALELPTHLRPASAYAALPALEALHARIGLDEAALLRATGGSFSLGWNIRLGEGAPFFLAHGAYGAPIGGADFFPCWVKARSFGLGAALEDFSPTAMAARHGRMLTPSAATEAFGRTDYAYHLPALAYVTLLKAHAVRLGVRFVQTTGIDLDRDGETGTLRAVTPVGGERVAGDLFVDAGEEALLVGTASVEDWRPLLPHDRRLVARARPVAPVPPYAELRRTGSGWLALHATRDATHIVRTCASGEESEQEALASLSALQPTDVSVASIRPGRRTQAWTGNVVAIGRAACTFDPALDLELHTIQLGIVHLLALFPAGDDASAERAEYNRITQSLFERLRDVQLALLTHGRSASTLPDSLAHRLETFRARGAVTPMEDETVSPDQWRALLTGLGLMPDSWPPAIDAIPPETLKEGFRRILAFVRETVLAQPTHDAYLAELTGRQAA